jgi:class 3 adenylate cyclase
MNTPPIKILVVDDERAMRDMASHILRSVGHDVTSVANGDEALARLPGDFEVILTDLDMPGHTSGIELTQRVRADLPIDVIIMTGYPDLSSAIHAVRGGAYDYLVKPFSPDTLLMSIDRCAAKRRLSKELERERALREELDHAYQELTRMQKVRDLFGQFTTPEVARFVSEHPDDYWKHGERRDVTVLFADIRGFTPFTGQVAPEEAVEALNRIFDVLISTVHEQGGFVNKFLGDGVMAVFGAPQPHADHAGAAARAATKARTMLQLSQHPLATGETLQVGFAINTGQVLAGCLGTRNRMEYSVIGSAVNMAARIEKIAGPGDILLGPETARQVAQQFELTSRGIIPLAGFSDPVEISALTAPRPGAFAALSR